jgi:carbon-monoxide dehydrogenase large subunit
VRSEDVALLTGARHFTADLVTSDALHAVFIRSDVAHGRLLSVGAGTGIYTEASLSLPALLPWPPTPARYARSLLAKDFVRYVGDPIAVALGESPAEAADLAETAEVEIDDLPAVCDPLLSEEVAFEVEPLIDVEALDDAEVVVKATFVNQKLAAVPIETNGIFVIPDDDGEGLQAWVPTQVPFDVRDALASTLGLDPARVVVRAPAVGGSFGAKGHPYPEHLVVASLALRTGRPVAWQESRRSNLLNMAHGRGQIQRVSLGARADGTLTGISVDIVADAGAYPHVGCWLPNYTRLMATGTYKIPRVDFRACSMVTNTAPVAAYRGAGRPEATAFLERAIDLLAVELELDPVEIRRMNLLESHDGPYETPTGAVYDSGNYLATLECVVERAGYVELRREQEARRRRNDRWMLGIGVSMYIEVTGNGPTKEYGAVAIEVDGTATVRCGVSSQGQGHETTYAQLAAGHLDVSLDRIRVVQSDTSLVPRGAGTYGSRSLQLAGSSIDIAARELVDQARQLAADRLEADVADTVVYTDVGIGVAGAPTSAIPWAELAPIVVEHDFDQGSRTYPFGAHISVVEVDAETGLTRMLRHVTVDDCGNIINPTIATGQQHGGIAQGAAQALWEEMIYDEDGQPRTASFMDYLAPSAVELPLFETNTLTTPTPLNPLGVKGLGEATTIGSTPAVHNAVMDALSPLGIHHIDMPLSPAKIWKAIHG